MKNSLGRSRHLGFTLIEVLVSITIGLIILTAIGVVYKTSSNLQRQREDQNEVNEPVKLILNLLKYNVSLAGYVDASDNPDYAAQIFRASDNTVNIFIRNPAQPISTPLSQVFPGLLGIFGCDGAMTSKSKTLAEAYLPTTAITLACGAGSTTQNSIQLAYHAVPSGLVSPTGTNSLQPANATTGEGRDCLQQTIAGTTGIVINRFYVKASPGDGINELYCEGSGNVTAQPIARGVEEFVLRYQLAQAGTTTAVDAVSAGAGKAQFLTATQVSADAVGWAGVVAVEVCMVTATPQTKGAAAAGTVQLQPTRPTCTRDTATGLFDANTKRAADDTRLWKRTNFTYTVRNAVFSAPS